ncbi:MAG: flagellar biosynthesis protein FlhB [Armatimonadota bacterium]
MAGDGAERSEKPTDKRKKDARKKGTVVKSMDIVSASVFLAFIMVLPVVIRMGYEGFIKSYNGVLNLSSGEPAIGNLSKVGTVAIQPLLMPMALLMGVAMMVGVLGNVVQVGLNFSGEALNPSFQKLNPMNGLKKLFGKPAIFDAFKSIVKLCLFAWLAYGVVKNRWIEIGMIWSLTPLGSMGLIGAIAKSILIKIVGAWAILAAIDYAFQKKQVDKQLMMTKQEVRQEMKDAEASPELKGHRMRMARKFSRMRPAQAVREADVIITNPTHFAIAVKYDGKKHHAPMVIAKGVDHMALKMREIATEAKVPIVENRPLARALYKECEVGDFVPRDLFEGVAEVLGYVYRMTNRVR